MIGYPTKPLFITQHEVLNDEANELVEILREKGLDQAILRALDLGVSLWDLKALMVDTVMEEISRARRGLSSRLRQAERDAEYAVALNAKRHPCPSCRGTGMSPAEFQCTMCEGMGVL